MTKPTLVLVWIGLLLGSSCSHYYYAPNTLQTPFLQQQHDSRVSVGVITGDELSGFELHGAYSPLKYGAIMVNYFDVRSDESNTGTPDEWGKGHQLEFALGGYYPIGKYTSLSLFGGWGTGRALNSFGPNVLADLRFQKRFLQPTFTVQGKWFRFGTALRFNQLEYKRGDIDFEIDQNELATIQNIEQASPIYIPETGFSVGFGHKAFWADFHLNICNSPRRKELGFLPSTFGGTITLELDKLWRKK